VIWESATTPQKFPLVTFTPKITHFRGSITKLNYLHHSWTHPTYHPKLHPYLISSFATMHQTDRQTNKWLDGLFDERVPLSNNVGCGDDYGDAVVKMACCMGSLRDHERYCQDVGNIELS